MRHFFSCSLDVTERSPCGLGVGETTARTDDPDRVTCEECKRRMKGGRVTVPVGTEDVSLVEVEKTFAVRLKDTSEIFLTARKRSDGSTLVRARHSVGDADHFVNAPLAVLKALVAVVEANQ